MFTEENMLIHCKPLKRKWQERWEKETIFFSALDEWSPCLPLASHTHPCF